MGQVTIEIRERFIAPFNGPVEIGLRSLTILNYAYPKTYSLRRLVIFDYLVVHSDDVPGGPVGLHPQTPHRGGELLIRRRVLQEGLLLYQSRGLVRELYTTNGVFYAATENSAGFLDVLDSEYIVELKERAVWLVDNYGSLQDEKLEQLVQENLGEWGAEFAMESVLWAQKDQ